MSSVKSNALIAMVAAQKVCSCIVEWIDSGKNGTKEAAA